jgi:hypothetical protein
MSTALSIGIAFILAAPDTKDPPPGPPMSEEQLLALLKEKGELTWANGDLRIKAKVEGHDLIDVELEYRVKGEVDRTLKSPRMRIKVDEKAKTLTIFCEELKIVGNGTEAELRKQEFELPAPRQGKRP